MSVLVDVNGVVASKDASRSPGNQMEVEVAQTLTEAALVGFDSPTGSFDTLKLALQKRDDTHAVCALDVLA